MQIHISEQQLEDMIFESKDVIHERGFLPMLSEVFRQFRLPSGKKIDILTYQYFERELAVYIIELKKDKAAQDALFQAYGYLNEYLISIDKADLDSIFAKVVLVGYKTEELPICNFLSLPVEIYTYSYHAIKGISFYQHRVINNTFVAFGEHEGGASLLLKPIDDIIDETLKGFPNFEGLPT